MELIQGKLQAANVRMLPSILYILYTIDGGRQALEVLNMTMQIVTQQVTVSNPGHAAPAVTWTSSNPAVVVEPAAASIAPLGEQHFQVHVSGLHVGQLQAQLLCLVKHGISQAVAVTAEVAGETKTAELRR